MSIGQNNFKYVYLYIAIALSGLIAFVPPLAFAEAEPIFTLVSEAGELTAQVVLESNFEAVNSFQTTVFFNPDTHSVATTTVTGELCEEQFIINHIVDNEAGIVYLECGTATPFVASSTPLLGITFNETIGVESDLMFGNRNVLAKHDGLGTLLHPTLVSF